MFTALINRRYDWDGSHRRNLFESRFKYSLEDGYYFEVTKNNAGYELEARKYMIMIKILCG